MPQKHLLLCFAQKYFFSSLPPELLPLTPLSNRQQHTNMRTPMQHKHDDTTENVTTPLECDDTQSPPHQTVSKSIQP